MNVIAKMAAAQTEGSSILFGGTLASLNLAAQAIPNVVDTGRIKHIMENMKCPEHVKAMLGTIAINSDECTHTDIKHLVRCHKDAEVHVACLVIYWNECVGACLETLRAAVSDVVFDARSMGHKCDFKVNKLKMVQKEDDDRKVMGLSAYRQTVFLTDLAADVASEGRYPDTADEAAKVQKLLHSCPGAGNWNVDTLKRYLALGRKLKDPTTAAILQRWEYMEQRNALVDGITYLRAVCAYPPHDLQVILQTMYMEQRAKLRTNRVACRGHNAATPGHIAKAVLLRAQVYNHLLHSFPMFKEELQAFIDHSCYKQFYGVSVTGEVDENFSPEKSDEEGDSDGEKVGGKEASSYRSRPMLLSLGRNMMRNRYERTYIAMAKEIGEVCSSANTAINELNLTLKSAAPLKKVIGNIAVAYALDFPPTKVSDSVVTHHGQVLQGGPVVQGSPNGALQVKLAACCENEAEYNVKIGQWNAEVARNEKQCIQGYINARVQWVVDEGDDTHFCS